VQKLAYELAEDGHLVDVIVGAKSAIADEAPSNNGGYVSYHPINQPKAQAFTGRLAKASPQLSDAFGEALAYWQKFVELHLQQMPFAVLDTQGAVLSTLLPAMCHIVPTVCTAQEKMAAFVEPASIFEPLEFDLQMSALLEVMTLDLADRITIEKVELAERLQRKSNIDLKKIDLINSLSDPTAKLAQYAEAINSHKKSKSAQFYLKSPGDLTSDAVMIFKAYDEMLYNFLYQNSFRFRFYHWWQMLQSNPTEFKGKLRRLMSKFAGPSQHEV